MDQTELQDHFQAATRPMPGPLGDDAIEWDYSRISRALGLVGKPTLQEVPHSGAAILAAPAALWESVAQNYRAWAADADWAFVRVSAQPTVAVPDPVVHALAMHCSGPDGLALARASRARRPKLGAKRRGAGSSIPLIPGERWLIAADRVRRRCRTEIAQRGLVIFVESAEMLSPCALGLLTYLIHAHCAWKGRMLSRPAMCYVVFATEPAHESLIETALSRFEIAGDIAGGRRTRVNGRRHLAALDVEEEHLLAALQDAPLALDSTDVTALFGSSGRVLCLQLCERGFLTRELVAGRKCFVPRPAYSPKLDDPPQRVRRAVFDRYRARARTGHEHVVVGAILLALRSGDLARARACLSQLTTADAACIPMVHLNELDAKLMESPGTLRASDMAALLVAHAHARNYDRALECAQAITERPFRSMADLARTVNHLVSVGRTHLTKALPKDFFASLNATACIDPSLLDATSILVELFGPMEAVSSDDTPPAPRNARRTPDRSR